MNGKESPSASISFSVCLPCFSVSFLFSSAPLFFSVSAPSLFFSASLSFHHHFFEKIRRKINAEKLSIQPSLFSTLSPFQPSFSFSFSAAPFFFLFQRLFLFLQTCCPLFFSPKRVSALLQPKILLVQPLSSLSVLAFLFSPHHCFSLFLFCFSLCSFCFTCCPLKAHKRVQLFLCVPPSQFLANF